MPNIIEQQDLLKGLADSRLALLMQKPDASIPPFLVAAEAQRRQSIRQQFAGDGSKESVVDTLTKQLANVPQNIQAPMQTPPQMPAPQAGIGALQQGMAGGGPVRRFAGAGFVAPTVDDLSGSYYSDPFGTPSITEGDASSLGILDALRGIGDYIAHPTSKPYTPPPDNNGVTTPDVPIPKMTQGPVEPSPYEDLTKPKKPRDEETGTNDSSLENKDKAESAAYRKRVEELFGANEPSNWEEAQKWFAMSSAIMEPGQNLMQGIASAGQIYAQAEGDQAAARRQDERELQKALLQYDLGERDYSRQVAAQSQTNKLEAMKYQAGAALKEAELYRKAADDAGDALNRQIAALVAGGAMQEDIAKDPTVKALQDKIAQANKDLKSATIRAQGFNTMFGNMYGLPAGFEASDGESFFNIGG